MKFRRLFSLFVLCGLFISQSAFSAVAPTTYCNHVQFVADLTVLDGTLFGPQEPFTKTWRLKNIGTCTWTTEYSLAFVGGDSMGAPRTVPLPIEVPPGKMVDLSVNMIAPFEDGNYRGNWMLKDPSGNMFGIGAKPSNSFWVEITVMQNYSPVYDFIANSPYAEWRSAAGPLPFPGTVGDDRGYALILNNPLLETNSYSPEPGLLTVPHNLQNGYIQAIYPEILIEKGDHFQAIVNCEKTAANCSVTFQLDYLLPTGKTRRLWAVRELNDGHFSRADVDLSLLAGQQVRFVLSVFSSGYAGEDRAVWALPRIVRPGGGGMPPLPAPTLTQLPPLTPTATPFDSLPEVPPYGCDRATFIADVTVPDGSLFTPGTVFTKTWKVRNDGTCKWTTAYNLVFYSGEQMGASTLVPIPREVYPGETVELSVGMTAPMQAGKYRSYWYLRNEKGDLFGIGANATVSIWAEVNVVGHPPTADGYDLVFNFCSAEWKSEAGALPCPGQDGDKTGFVAKQDSPRLEDGSAGGPGLILSPQYVYNGYIQGVYPAFTVQPGDHLQFSVGCEYGTDCLVTFRLDYVMPNGSTTTLWTKREMKDGQPSFVDIDMSPLAGRSIRLMMTMLASGHPTNDRALWDGPRILHAVVPATPVPPSTPTTVTTDWLTFTNQKYGFQFRYPKDGQSVSQQDNAARIKLPTLSGSTVVEKYLDVDVAENVAVCQSPLTPLSSNITARNVVVNGVTYLKETGWDMVSGQIHQWIGYSATKDNLCLSMNLVMNSTNPGNYLTPLPPPANETTLIIDVVKTLTWMAPTPIPSLTITPTITVTPEFFGEPATDSTPTAFDESTQTGYFGPYAVTRLSPGMALNVYSGAGDANPVIASFASDATGIMRTQSPSVMIGNVEWVEVIHSEGVIGWVNSYFLTEYVTRDAFCSDARILPLIAQLRDSMNISSGDSFSVMVSPKHGVDVRLWKYQSAVNFDLAKSANIFVSPESFNWGGGPSGIPVVGTFAQIIQPKLLEVLNASTMQSYCDDLTNVYPLPNPWPLEYNGIHFYNLYKPPSTEGGNDYRTWLIGFEYINGQPYLYGMVSIVWEP